MTTREDRASRRPGTTPKMTGDEIDLAIHKIKMDLEHELRSRLASTSHDQGELLLQIQIFSGSITRVTMGGNGSWKPAQEKGLK